MIARLISTPSITLSSGPSVSVTPSSGNNSSSWMMPSQESIPEPKKVLILGAGAIGSNLAANLLVDRTPLELEIVDFDKIENRNLQAGTQLFFREQLGQSKVIALQYNLYKLFGKRVKTHEITFGSQDYSWFDRFHLIVDCFDNYEARKAIYDYDKPHILHAGFSRLMTFSLLWNENYEVPSDDPKGIDICELQGARSFIQYVSGLTGLVASNYLQNEVKINLIGNKFIVRKIT